MSPKGTPTEDQANQIQQQEYTGGANGADQHQRRLVRAGKKISGHGKGGRRQGVSERTEPVFQQIQFCPHSHPQPIFLYNPLYPRPPDPQFPTTVHPHLSPQSLPPCNHLHIHTGKTKEMVNIWGLDIEVVESYKYLEVQLNNNLDWTENTEALYKGQDTSTC